MFWGSSIDHLQKKIVSLRNKWNYNKTKEKSKERSALNYASNPEPKKLAYHKKKNEKDQISHVALKEFERAGR